MNARLVYINHQQMEPFANSTTVCAWLQWLVIAAFLIFVADTESLLSVGLDYYCSLYESIQELYFYNWMVGKLRWVFLVLETIFDALPLYCPQMCEYGEYEYVNIHFINIKTYMSCKKYHMFDLYKSI